MSIHRHGRNACTFHPHKHYSVIFWGKQTKLNSLTVSFPGNYYQPQSENTIVPGLWIPDWGVSDGGGMVLISYTSLTSCSWEAFLRPHIDQPHNQLDKVLPLCARGPKSEPQHQIPGYGGARLSIIPTQEVHTITPTQEVHTIIPNQEVHTIINHLKPGGRGRRIRSVTPWGILQVQGLHEILSKESKEEKRRRREEEGKEGADMAWWLRVLSALAVDLSSAPCIHCRWLTIACNSNIRRVNALFWPL